MSLRGLYAVADTATLAGRDFAGAVEAALIGGAAVVQYRDKTNDSDRRRREAGQMVGLCRQHHVLCVINDDIDLAAHCGADGVHVGAGDADAATARRHLGPRAIVGVSCYDELERAVHAVRTGADYVAFGRMFPSTTKPGGPRPPLGILREARRRTGLPVCAIGGIRLDNAGMAIAAGADLVAVIGDLFAVDDIRSRAAAYAALFEQTPPASSSG